MFVQTDDSLVPVTRVEQRSISDKPGDYGIVLHAQQAPKVCEREDDPQELEDDNFPEVEVKRRKGGKAKANAGA